MLSDRHQTIHPIQTPTQAGHLTQKEARRYLKLSREEFAAAVSAGEIPWFPRNRRGDRGFRLADLDRWVESRLRKSPTTVEKRSQCSKVAEILDRMTGSKTGRFSVTSQ